MAIPILVIGESGSGKSYSLRNLNPEETFIINVLDKPLPFPGSRKIYIKSSEQAMKGNYCATDKTEFILAAIAIINSNRPEIKTLIIDDFQYVMSNEFMRRGREKGFDKFTEIGMNVHMIIDSINSVREDLNTIILTHSEIGGDGKSRCKTIGKVIDSTVVIEGRFTIVLQTCIIDRKYRFITQNDGLSIAKSPFGMFEEYIDNDIKFVIEQANAYFNL